MDSPAPGQPTDQPASGSRGRKLSLTAPQQQDLLNDLSAGLLSHAQIARKYAIHPSTVTHVRERSIIRIEETKKQLLVTRSATDFNRALTVFADQAGATIIAGMAELTPEKLAKCSASQLAVVVGILFDKLTKLQEGLGEQTTAVRFESRTEMIAYIERGTDPAAAAAEPVQPSPEPAGPVPASTAPDRPVPADSQPRPATPADSPPAAATEQGTRRIKE